VERRRYDGGYEDLMQCIYTRERERGWKRVTSARAEAGRGNLWLWCVCNDVIAVAAAAERT
jgi:hypothetical protein